MLKFGDKRYNSLAFYYRFYGIKVQKAIIDIGSTCPNIDGTKAFGGCVYCDGKASYFSRGSHIPISEQLSLETHRIYSKWKDVKILAYFQGGTNTYIATDKLRDYCDEILSYDNIYGISIATRPDCLSEDMYEFLTDLSKRTNLSVELGLQTIHDSTAEIINRAYKFSVFESSFKRLKALGIRVCVHLINGLPCETTEMMIETAKIIGSLRPNAVKIHLLHVIKGTALAKTYMDGGYIPMQMDEYIDTIISQLEFFSPETVIERLTGDADKEKLIAPLWSRDKLRVLGTIEKKMKEKSTCQGMKFEGNSNE